MIYRDVLLIDCSEITSCLGMAIRLFTAYPVWESPFYGRAEMGREKKASDVNMRQAKGCLLATFALAFVLPIAGLWLLNHFGNDTAIPAMTVSTQSAEPPLGVSANALSQAFQDNEANAKLTYDGKTLAIAGVVKEIDLNFMNSPVITMSGANEVLGMGVSEGGKISDVRLTGLSQEQAATLKKGAPAILVCTGIGEALGGALANGCTLP